MVTRPRTIAHYGWTAQMMCDAAQSPEELRMLASWYRAFAEQAGNPVIWESRLLMAESLEAEAERVEDELAAARRGRIGGES
jgi:hypothetical protein